MFCKQCLFISSYRLNTAFGDHPSWERVLMEEHIFWISQQNHTAHSAQPPPPLKVKIGLQMPMGQWAHLYNTVAQLKCWGITSRFQTPLFVIALAHLKCWDYFQVPNAFICNRLGENVADDTGSACSLTKLKPFLSEHFSASCSFTIPPTWCFLFNSCGDCRCGKLHSGICLGHGGSCR